MAYLNIPANEKLRSLDRGQAIGALPLNPAATGVVAGMIATIVNVSGVGYLDMADGVNIHHATAPTECPVGIFADDYSEVVGTNALQPSGGSKKISFYHGFGRYMTLTYVDAANATQYVPGDPLFVGTGGNEGKLTRVSPAASLKPVAVCVLAPQKTTTAVFNATTNPYAEYTEVPEFLKGTQFGARPADAIRLLPDGSKRPYLGFIWL